MDMSWQALLQEAAATSFEKTADTLAAAENDNCACNVLMIVGAIYHQIGNPTKMVSYSSMLSRLAAMTGREAGIMYNKLRKLENA